MLLFLLFGLFLLRADASDPALQRGCQAPLLPYNHTPKGQFQKKFDRPFGARRNQKIRIQHPEFRTQNQPHERWGPTHTENP